MKAGGLRLEQHSKTHHSTKGQSARNFTSNSWKPELPLLKLPLQFCRFALEQLLLLTRRYDKDR